MKKIKKYCLTDCARQKISVVTEGTIAIVVGVLLIFGILLAFVIVSTILGFIGQGLWVTFLGPFVVLPAVSLIEFGSTILLAAVLGLAAGVLIYKALKAIYVWLRIIVTNNIVKRNSYGEETVCHIFEECEDSEDSKD